MARKHYVRGVCKTCDATIHLEVDPQRLDSLPDGLSILTGFECPGQHVVLGTALDAYTWDWTPVEREEPASDEEFGHALIAIHGRDAVYHMGPDALSTALGIPRLQSVSGLEHLGLGDFASATYYFVRRDSPNGTRFYIRSDYKRAS